MKIFKISQAINDDYDTYDSAVVCAENEEDARHIHPSPFVTHCRGEKWYGTHTVEPYEEFETENKKRTSWVQLKEISQIEVVYIGEADEAVKRGVIVSSFNAG